MGLTIHYKLGLDGRSSLATATRKLEALRAYAATLGLKEVSEVRQFEGEHQCNFESYGRDDEWGWFMVQAQSHVQDPIESRYSWTVNPARIVGFRTLPGEGCEEANFGLAQLPPTLTKRDGRVIKLPKSWRWSSFCKTQYANDPEAGGMPNFLRCHLTVVALLDKAKEIGLLQNVSDEGGYWERRDAEALAREVGEWDELVAAVAGQIKDALGGSDAGLEAPILARPDFEHLEARGVSRAEKPEQEERRES